MLLRVGGGVCCLGVNPDAHGSERLRRSESRHCLCLQPQTSSQSGARLKPRPPTADNLRFQFGDILRFTLSETGRRCLRGL